MASGDGCATMKQVLIAILRSEIGHQRKGGRCFGDDALVVLVKQRDERPRSACLASAELGKGREGGIFGGRQPVIRNDMAVRVQDGSRQEGRRVPVVQHSSPLALRALRREGAVEAIGAEQHQTAKTNKTNL